jgi:plastocyanin
MHKVNRATRVGFVAVLVAAAVAGVAAAGMAAHSARASTRVTVTEREYKITLSRHTFRAGSMTFVVHNAGRLAHEFAIKGPGIGTKRIHGTIAPGSKKTLTVKLRNGKFTLWCPIHVSSGMKTTIKVGAGASTGGTTTGTTTSTTSAWG